MGRKNDAVQRCTLNPSPIALRRSGNTKLVAIRPRQRNISARGFSPVGTVTHPVIANTGPSKREIGKLIDKTPCNRLLLKISSSETQARKIPNAVNPSPTISNGLEIFARDINSRQLFHILATVTAGGLILASSLSISRLMLRSANSADTRNAFLIAFAFDEPCVMKQTPLIPSSGAPPYSV